MDMSVLWSSWPVLHWEKLMCFLCFCEQVKTVPVAIEESVNGSEEKGAKLPAVDALPNGSSASVHKH